MNASLAFDSTLDVTPSGSFGPGGSTTSSPLTHRAILKAQRMVTIDLTDDAYTDVPIVDNAHILQLSVVGGKVLLKYTTADGTAQVIPVEDLMVLVCKTSPITALQLKRPLGAQVSVQLFTGERA